MDTISTSSGYRFKGFRLERHGELLREDGTSVPLGSRAVGVLQLLVGRGGQLVPKQDIMDAVWPGLAVEESNLTVQISALRKALDAAHAGPSCIQTVTGRGYRFAWPITPITAAGEAASPAGMLEAEERSGPSEAAGPGAPGASPSVRRVQFPVLAATFGAVCAAGLFMLASAEGPPARPLPRLSIVVLPFQDLGGDPENDHWARAVTDDLTTDLSRLPGFIVVPHESASLYRGAAVDARKAGAELGVRYVLKGTVRKLDEMVRVNVQLIGTEGGANLWAYRADEKLNSGSAGEQAAVARLGQTLRVALVDIESARGKRERPDNPDALDLINQARSLVLHDMGPREQVERIRLLERAVRLDPTSIMALTELAGELIRATDYNRGEGLERAAGLLQAAAAINPNDRLVLSGNGWLLDVQGRNGEAIAAYQRLVDEYPDDIGALTSLAGCLTAAGRSEEAVPLLETAIRRGPRHPRVWSRYRLLGRALLYLDRNEEAIVWTKRALAANPSEHPPIRATYHLRIAAAYARLEQHEEARRAIAEANRIWPYATVRERAPESLESPLYLAQIERYRAALRLAGLRDHAEEDADFGIASEDVLRSDLAGPTPMAAPAGTRLIRTVELERLLAEQKPVVIDPLLSFWGRSIPGAIGLMHAGVGGSFSDGTQDRLRRTMRDVTKDDRSAPIVAVGFNSERFDGRNLALRLGALGYTNVHWYRGGREAWEVAGLPEQKIEAREW